MEKKEYREMVKAAVQGLLGGHGPYDMPSIEVARKAIEIADAVVEALDNKPIVERPERVNTSTEVLKEKK